MQISNQIILEWDDFRCVCERNKYYIERKYSLIKNENLDTWIRLMHGSGEYLLAVESLFMKCHLDILREKAKTLKERCEKLKCQEA